MYTNKHNLYFVVYSMCTVYSMYTESLMFSVNCLLCMSCFKLFSELKYVYIAFSCV